MKQAARRGPAAQSRCSGALKPRARISPRPSAAPVSNARCTKSLGRSATARLPITTAATSTSGCSTPSSAASPPPSRRAANGFRATSRAGPARPGAFRPMPGTDQAVSPAVKASLLARSGRSGVLRMKETEIAALLLLEPDLAARHGELLADLPFTDRELDRFRHVLLNLAASGSSLEKQGFETHLTRLGMTDLVRALARNQRVASIRRKRTICRQRISTPAFSRLPAIFAKWRNGLRSGPAPWSVSNRGTKKAGPKPRGCSATRATSSESLRGGVASEEVDFSPLYRGPF